MLSLLFPVLGVPGCGAANYVWVDELVNSGAQPVQKGDYTIAPGDLLSVRVYNQETLSGRSRVRPDGKIAIPLVGEVEARGTHPADLAKEIGERLKPFLVAPSVSINVEQVEPARVVVVGEVTHPGVFTVLPGDGVLQALALAGGTTKYADLDRVFVLRVRPATGSLRIRFTYGGLSRGVGRGSSFALQPGDMVIVE